jgi:hypothetical protein
VWFVTFFWFREGELATDFPAAKVYAVGFAWVRPAANRQFAVLAAIIASWVAVCHQLRGFFRSRLPRAIQFDAETNRLVPAGRKKIDARSVAKRA